MKSKFTLTIAALFAFALSGFAQGDSLKITVDLTQLGCTPGMVGAQKVYMHSGLGAGTPTDVWEYVVGNWGQDDGVGEMSPTSTTDVWEITIHLIDYYSTASNGPVPADSTPYNIGLVFRSADGSLEGKDKDCADIFIRGLDTPTPTVENSDGTAFAAVTAEWVNPSGINDIANMLNDVQAMPNPATNQTTIQYHLTEQVDNFSIVVYNALGQVVATLQNGAQAPGQHSVTWNLENVDNGVYFYTLTNGASTLTNKLMVIR